MSREIFLSDLAVGSEPRTHAEGDPIGRDGSGATGRSQRSTDVILHVVEQRRLHVPGAQTGALSWWESCVSHLPSNEAQMRMSHAIKEKYKRMGRASLCRGD